MKQKIIGVYPCGGEEVQLILREGTGGEFYTMPGKGCIARIKVGADAGHGWSFLVGTLMHEVMEFSMTRAGLRYGPAPDYSLDNGNYLFVMTHTQFSEASARAAMFLAAALPDLSGAWKKWKR